MGDTQYARFMEVGGPPTPMMVHPLAMIPARKSGGKGLEINGKTVCIRQMRKRKGSHVSLELLPVRNAQIRNLEALEDSEEIENTGEDMG